jgi:hypothetical protein
MPLADMRSGDLEVDTVPSGRNVPREDEDYEDIEDDDTDQDFD